MSRIVDQIVRELKADRKKLGLVIGLVAVGLLLWGRLLLKDVPRTATATPPIAAATAGGEAPAEVPAIDTRRQYAETVIVRIPPDLPRDMFAMDTSSYRKTEIDAPVPLEPKVQSPAVDKEFRRAKVREAASGLQLEGIVLGEQPAAIINGELFQAGQTVEGFLVTEIEDRKVVLEMDGIRVRMSM